MLFLKRQLPLIIAFIMGVAFAIQYYIPHQWSEEQFTRINDWMVVIAGFSFFLGLASLTQLHYTRIRRKEVGWGFSAVMFLALILTFLAGWISEGETAKEGGTVLTSFGWIYDNMMVPLSQTVFSILAFFIASVAFRAFRARTFDAVLLLLAALIVMLGRVPIGEYLWTGLFGDNISLRIGEIASWVMNVPNMAARRGVMIGVALGTIATSLKIIVGIERGYLGGEGE